MIDIHILGESANEVLAELRTLSGSDKHDCCHAPAVPMAQSEPTENDTEAKQDDPVELLALLAERDLHIEELENKVTGYEELLTIKKERIAELEKQLADAEAVKTAKPKKTKKASAPACEEEETVTPPEVAAEEEQTEIPEAPAEPDEPEAPVEPEAPAKEVKKEDVRAVLVKCREAGLALTEILEPYGGSLGAVKKEDYANLMRDAEAALEGK